mmetsp:Transcript_46226/g.76428  ORF Transcript_46226/g.76428 Transcript_46226/m.76428 type:complete len:339 (+) Transcript_46226:16-1032(+)
MHLHAQSAFVAAAVGAGSFRHFSDHLYCSGSQERSCAVLSRPNERLQPGQCLWYSKGSAVTTKQVEAGAPGLMTHTWDPVKAGAVYSDAFPNVDVEKMRECVRGKRIHFAGDSTLRDTYEHLTRVARLKEIGRPGRMTRTRQTEVDTAGTWMSFQFLAKANTSQEIGWGRTLLSGQSAHVVFIQCMMYDLLEEIAQMGEACMQYLDALIGAHQKSELDRSARAQVILLGPTFPPNWVEAYGNRTQPDSRMSRIFESINRAAGISCLYNRKTDEYTVVSRHGIKGPVDRYNTVGHRKPDRIHPAPAAQQAIVRMMLRHICGPHGAATQVHDAVSVRLRV